MNKSTIALLTLTITLGMTTYAQKTESTMNIGTISLDDKKDKDKGKEFDQRNYLTAGVKTGANISNVWDSRGEDFQANPRLGMAGGVWIGIPLGKFFGLQPEILYSQKGCQASGTLLGSDYSFVRTAQYIDVPLQFQVKPVKFLTFVGGPQYSYLLKQRYNFTFGDNAVAQQIEFNNDNDNIRKNILGFVVGTDLIISHFVLSGRMGADFMNNNGDGTTSTPRYKNAWMQLTVGIKI